MGEDWFHQGIYGPNGNSNIGGDQSWGWTFFDENRSSGFIVPSENVTQKNNIYVLLLDDGNNSSPVSGASVTANITYWTYDSINYSSHVKSVPLYEDFNHKGFYKGSFYFYGGTPYGINDGKMIAGCYGCHYSLFQGKDMTNGYFPGKYNVTVTANADGKNAVKDLSFNVTPWGCEDCHGSGSRHRAKSDMHIVSGIDMDSACYVCHGINGLIHAGAGNPHQNTAHRNINCEYCHTNKSLDFETFNGITFTANNMPQYSYNIIPLSRGNHSGVSCEECHKDLLFPKVQGEYKSENYIIDNIINRYNPDFAAIQPFQDYYIINVSAGPLNINLNWEGNAKLGFYLYPPNFNPRNWTGAVIPDGAAFDVKPQEFNDPSPMTGKWIVHVYGYDLLNDPELNRRYGSLHSSVNYSISSTFPVQKKELPWAPECSDCHNSKASGRSYTKYDIPGWNDPGFAHTDINNDSNPDIQCRMCHGAMHNISVNDCHSCHNTVPSDHPIKMPNYFKYSISQCLKCHGDPHNITSAGGTDCMACHSPGDVNTSKFARHSDVNMSDGDGNVTNSDCWMCHYMMDMDRNHIHLCDSCHSNNSGIVPIENVSLVVSDFVHGMTTCKTCHAPFSYHLGGTAGPLGAVENILYRKI